LTRNGHGCMGIQSNLDNQTWLILKRRRFCKFVLFDTKLPSIYRR